MAIRRPKGKTKLARKPTKQVVLSETRNDQMSLETQTPPSPDSDKHNEIVAALESYRQEAKTARESGLNDRDTKWRENLDLYWNRYDFTKKAKWQAQETMPEVPSYVDRFAAALKEALISNPTGFYTVSDPADKDQMIGNSIKAANDVWLSRAGRNQMGQLLPFTSIFEEQMKLGAIMAISTVTNWKEDVEDGRVSIETVDPRKVWLDPTYRNLYRIREIEMDRHDLYSLTADQDSNGDPLYNIPDVERLITDIQDALIADKERSSGHGQNVSSGRSPVTLHEYIATVVDATGKKIADKSLMVVANNKFLIRGPEKNPFWHNSDWLINTPLVTVPLSVYGRSYMEDFGSVAKTFTELTNMLLDAVHTSAMKAFAVIPGMLLNPQQAAEGLSPNKMFLLEEGMGKAQDFAHALDLGTLPPDAFKFWAAMKDELSEAAKINEIGMGQFAPKGRTSAFEVSETQQNSSSLIRSVAETVELRWLDPQLDLSWKTGLQHVKPTDGLIRAAMGDQMFDALIVNKKNRKELASRPFTFQARGISTLLKKAQMIKVVMQILQVVAANPALLAAFMQKVDMQKFVDKLFEWSNVDLTSLQPSQRELMIRQATQPLQQAADQAGGAPGQGGQPGQGQPPGGPGANEMGQVAQQMGVAK